MLSCQTLSREKFMVPQNLQVESQNIPVLCVRCLEQEAALSQSAAGIFINH